MKNLENQIKEWKALGHEVVGVTFDDGKACYFKTPNRKELKLILSKGGQGGGPVTMTDTYIKNCYLGGDVSADCLASDAGTAYLAQIAASIDDLINTKRVEIKKL